MATEENKKDNLNTLYSCLANTLFENGLKNEIADLCVKKIEDELSKENGLKISSSKTESGDITTITIKLKFNDEVISTTSVSFENKR